MYWYCRQALALTQLFQSIDVVLWSDYLERQMSEGLTHIFMCS